MSISVSSNYIGWMVSKLKEGNEVDSVEITGDRVIKIVMNKGEVYRIGGIDTPNLNLTDLREYLEGRELNFIVSKGGLGYAHGDALELLRERNIEMDSFGRVAYAITLEDPSSHLDKENKFISRGLIQHSDVFQLNRVTNRKYEILRFGLSNLTILAIGDYDLSAEAVRSSVAIHGSCDLIAASNPYARITPEAVIAAQSMGAEIFKWGELLSRISR